MRGLSSLAGCVFGLLAAGLATAGPNTTSPAAQRNLFTPPQVFQHTNLVRNVDLSKSYARDTVNIIVENIDSKPQQTYYFPASTEGRLGGLEARDKKKADEAPLKVELADGFYKITLSPALKPKESITLALSYSLLGTYSPLPAKIDQTDQQFLAHSFSALLPSAYTTLKQKTKVKFPSSTIPDFTTLQGKHSSENAEDPVKQGSTLTYGPFGKVNAGASEPVQVRFEATHPVNYVSKLERDLEVSHWGGNLATEERYWYENRGASLKTNFDRVKWAATAYYSPPTAALKEFSIPLRKGAANPYFVDDVGNVSTSHFRARGAAPLLELKPRYPIFGDWKYKFKIGYDHELSSFLRKAKTGGDSYVLKVPFLEGPKQSEGIAYENVQVRVILPEGATNIQFDTDGIDIVSDSQSVYKSYMDTVGRTALTLEAHNVIDELRGKEILITYDYPDLAGFRKPVTIIAGVFAVFVTAWALSLIDVSITKKTTA